MTPPKEFFSESDCDMANVNCLINGPNPVHGISLAKANALIRERSRVVYGTDSVTHKGTMLWGESHYKQDDTHQALLINVEKIEQSVIPPLPEPRYGEPTQRTLDDWCEWMKQVESAFHKLLERKDGV